MLTHKAPDPGRRQLIIRMAGLLTRLPRPSRLRDVLDIPASNMTFLLSVLDME